MKKGGRRAVSAALIVRAKDLMKFRKVGVLENYQQLNLDLIICTKHDPRLCIVHFCITNGRQMKLSTHP